MVLCILHGCRAKTAFTSEKLASSIMQVEQRLKEETETDPSELNSFKYLWAIGGKPARSVSPRQMKAKRILILKEYLQLDFINSNEIKRQLYQRRIWFYYAEFAKQPMQYKVVKDSKKMRSAIAHILWITDD